MPCTTIKFLLLLACASTGGASALSSADHPIFGAASITRDFPQGLDWLTPNATLGLSFVETQALLTNDPRFAGFRVATLSELGLLYSEALIQDINVAGYGALYGTTANVPGVTLLQGLTGKTYTAQVAGQSLAETAGFVGDAFISPINGFLSVYIGNTGLRLNVNIGSGALSFASAYTTWGAATVGTQYTGVGTWLVTSVPEPSQWAILLGGLLVLARVRARIVV